MTLAWRPQSDRPARPVWDPEPGLVRDPSTEVRSRLVRVLRGAVGWRSGSSPSGSTRRWRSTRAQAARAGGSGATAARTRHRPGERQARGGQGRPVGVRDRRRDERDAAQGRRGRDDRAGVVVHQRRSRRARSADRPVGARPINTYLEIASAPTTCRRWPWATSTRHSPCRSTSPEARGAETRRTFTGDHADVIIGQVSGELAAGLAVRPRRDVGRPFGGGEVCGRRPGRRAPSSSTPTGGSCVRRSWRPRRRARHATP